MAGSRFGKCPPGVFCITPGFVVLCVLLVVAAGAFWIQMSTALQRKESLEPAPIVASGAPVLPVAVQIAAGAVASGGDDRYTRAPKPERHWATEPDLPTSAEIYGKLPRVPTRGIPEAYQSMGVITMEDGAVLPLYGRRTAARSDRFQYYTRTDTYNPVQLPLSYKRRDCQDDVGCDELFDGENVKVAATNQTGRVTVYRFDGPTYVPGIL